MLHLITLGLVALSSSITSGEDRKTRESFDDAQFVMKAASGGMHEVALGKLTASRAKRDDVKKFGERMVTDHGKAGEELKIAAKAAGLPVPDKMNAEHQKEFDRFRDYKGEDFDGEYINHMIADHEKDVAEFTRASKEATNPGIRDFATKTLPVVKAHLEMVKKLKK